MNNIDWNKTIKIMGDVAFIPLHIHSSYEINRQLKCRTCPRTVDLDKPRLEVDDFVYQEYREKNL